MAEVLQRQHLSISRAAEYFRASELQAQTGQPTTQFLHVILKELIDNSLDAAESAGRAPDITVEFQRLGGWRLRLAVQDNGDGIPPDVVERILDFNTRTSDKAAYRAPTRGAQGNALKTVLGIPIACHAERSHVGITAAGIRHDITLWSTPAGDVRHDHRQTPAETAGTRVEVIVPSQNLIWSPVVWTYSYALVNPHARLQIRELPPEINLAEFEDDSLTDLLFQPTVTFPGGDWRKFLPTDTTPVGWYSRSEFNTLVHLKAAVHPAQPLGDFVREFRGLSRKWREVCQAVEAKTVGELAESAGAVLDLQLAMEAAAILPRPETLGRVGPDHFRRLFHDQFGICGDDERFWYKHKFGVDDDDRPFLVEVAIAETHEQGQAFYGLNFSVPFGDPLAGTLLHYEPGLAGLLQARGVYNGERDGRPLNTVSVIHLAMPVLPSLDRGKSRLALSRKVASVIAEAVCGASKVLAEEWQRWLRNKDRKDRRNDQYERQARSELMTKKAAAESLLIPTYMSVTENETIYVTSRDQWYTLRPPYQRLNVRPSKNAHGEESTAIDYDYFSQKLLPPFRREVHPLTMIDYKARGTLYLPHSNEEVAIGDKELRDWNFPEWEVNKVLFIEKEGVWETLKQTGGIELAQRYDLAIAACEGYATESARKLMAKAQQSSGYQIFVFHDADPDGYNICRTLAEETARMPDHRIQVYDLGLKVDEALAMGLLTETFTRKKALPSTLLPRLSDTERRMFEGNKVRVGPDKFEWRDCERVEINAIPVRERVAYLERQLQAIPDLLPRVRPPAEVLLSRAQRAVREEIERRVRYELEQKIDLDGIVAAAVRQIGQPVTFKQDDLPGVLDGLQQKKPELSWRNALDQHIYRELDGAELDVEAAVAEAVRDILFSDDVSSER